jgi:long-chain acyl-CoA synthetase
LYNLLIFEGYGQSEAGPVIFLNSADRDIVPGSIGPPLPLTEIKIADVATGDKILATGEQGEICLRGPQIMLGYRNRPEETAAALRQGWLFTGDIGELDEAGNLYIRDHKKNMALGGSYNVYPREIDEVLYTHPDVIEAKLLLPRLYSGMAAA